MLRHNRFDVGSITLLPCTAEIAQDARIQDFAQAMEFSQWCLKHAPWWVAELLLGLERKFGDTGWQAVNTECTSLDHLNRCRAAAASIPSSVRRPELSFTHHLQVVNLPIELQKQLLDRAVSEGWNSGEMRKQAVMKKRK